MQKQNTKRSRVRNLVVISALMAVVLTTATYAWFIGMQSVNVTSFDVEIKTTDGLTLSLDGTNFAPTVAITKATADSASYDLNTNSWGDLIPMSTIGDMSVASSRMKLFEKSSLTATPGGYRIMASLVNNSDSSQKEPDGYVAFDLFVRNLSGTQYIDTNDILDEEAIYLTTDSGAKVSAAGVADTGIENSVRVAFAQIGRVIGTTSVGMSAQLNEVTGITCTDDDTTYPGTKITGICRTAQIWEPNDRKHVQAAIDWYDTACRPRTAAEVDALEETDITKAAAFDLDGSCGEVVNGTSYPTYAVKAPIVANNRVDVYDGAAYNGYSHVTWKAADKSDYLLESYAYFTDTMKMLPGVQRPEFMRLAPNSITKVRVYIYIEGQDIDNYDFAQIGKAITINFGFTKDRFNPDDIEYTGPALDPTSPVIALTDDDALGNEITVGTPYVDHGATVTDDTCNAMGDPEKATCEATLQSTLVVNSSAVNENVIGSYLVTYTATDSEGHQGLKTRTVLVKAGG